MAKKRNIGKELLTGVQSIKNKTQQRFLFPDKLKHQIEECGSHYEALISVLEIAKGLYEQKAISKETFNDFKHLCEIGKSIQNVQVILNTNNKIEFVLFPPYLLTDLGINKYLEDEGIFLNYFVEELIK